MVCRGQHPEIGVSIFFRFYGLLATVWVLGCASTPKSTEPVMPKNATSYTQVRVTEHRQGDDLLSAGLGLSGLRALQAPAPADPAQPTAAELRRRAIYTSWRGIADLRPGEFGERYGKVETVIGREWNAFLRLPSARHTHRALVQVPDAFDARKRCLIVTASSGSRGIYGAIAVAGAFGLTQGCAVAYTDKGAGSGVFDFASQTGVQLDGTRAHLGQSELEFAPPTDGSTGDAVAFKHAHSGDFPDADWGQHVLQAAEFGLHALNQAFPELAPFTAENTRIMAVGLSNGGGAALRAAELDSAGLIDAVVVAAPNITAPGQPSLLEYASLAALLQPCAMSELRQAPRINPFFPDPAPARCAQLQAQGFLEGKSLAGLTQSALAKLRAFGFRDATLNTGASNVELDLWRSILATYLQSYTRAGLKPSCGYRFTAGAATPAQQALWAADFSGLAPSAGITLVDGLAVENAADPALPGLLCVYDAVRTAKADPVSALGKALSASLAQPEKLRVPALLVHGQADGLIPMEFTSAPYSLAARDAGARVALWQVESAQHFDAFLGFPSYGAAYVGLLEPMQAAMQQGLDHLLKAEAWPEDRVISPSR